MNPRPDAPEISGRLRDLIDEYCSDLIDEAGLAELEAGLRSSESARLYFAEYVQLHAELGFSARARRAASSALSRMAEGRAASRLGRLPKGRFRRRWLAVAGAAIAASGFLLGQWAWSRRGDDIAWLVNAQDCRWSTVEESPTRDMRAGKVLKLERGLAEIEFDRGARVILKGPASLELLSDNMARLISGSMTAHVPPPAQGFTVYSPQGKVVDLGTEFGLSVDDPDTTSVRVFSGKLTAEARAEGSQTVHLVQDQAARIDGRAVALRPPGYVEGEAGRFPRAIVPPPEIRRLDRALAFDAPVQATLLDGQGLGTGLTHRLPGTGSALATSDANLRLRPDRRALELTTTRSDLNKTVGLDVGEYLGFRLRDLGFTGREDFTVSVEFPDIPGLEVVGQFGLYAGTRNDRSIRGGVLRQPEAGSYTLFLVNNEDGIDRDVHEVGLTRTGDHLRFTLRRAAGRYSLLVENLTRASSSTLAISHPAFLDGEPDLYVGVFGANTQSDVRKTLTIKDLAVSVFTESPAPTIR
ncbi:FecR domain-containing protein [Tundrisphaera lichenicola]|uniref:FecR domain-containing protein n=1 Tax=Tundrisphaera lichenicola TaxID=2029860 RepID=UPI003EBB7C2C